MDPVPKGPEILDLDFQFYEFVDFVENFSMINVECDMNFMNFVNARDVISIVD